jgi:hypothetical protein
VKLQFSRQVFEKYSNIRFYENPSSGGRVVTCGRTDMTNRHLLFAILRTRVKSDRAVLCRTVYKVLARITHCDIDVDLTDCDWFLHAVGTSRHCWSTLSDERLELCLVSVKNSVSPWFRSMLVSRNGRYTGELWVLFNVQLGCCPSLTTGFEP